MADETNDSLNRIIEQITCKLLLHDDEFNYLDNNDEKQKAERTRIYGEKRDQTEEVIRKLCKVVEKQLPPGISIPSGIEVLVARKLLLEMKDGDIANIEFSNNDAQTLLKEYRSSLNNNKEIEDVETNVMENVAETVAVAGIMNVIKESYFKDVSNFPSLEELDPSSPESVKVFMDEVSRNGGLTNDQGINVVFHDDEYPDDQYTEGEKRTEDTIKTAAEILEEASRCQDPEKRKQCMERFDNFADNSGEVIKADARMRMLTDVFNIDDLDYNGDFVLEQVEAWTQDFQEEGYDFDAHSAGNVLNFLNIVNQRCNEVRKQEIFEIIGRTCPELYEVYEQCPDIVDAMQPNILGFDFVSEIILDGKPLGTLDEFFQGIEKYREEHSLEEIERMAGEKRNRRKTGQVQEQERDSDEPVSIPDVERQASEETRPEQERDKTQITMEEKMENFKKNMLKMAQAKGAAAALKFANNLIMNRNDAEREALTSSVIEVVAQEEFIQTAKEDDLDTIREIISGCLDEDNKKQNPQLIDYVQALGGVSRDIKSRVIKSRVKAQEITVDEHVPDVPVIEGNELEL